MTCPGGQAGHGRAVLLHSVRTFCLLSVPTWGGPRGSQAQSYVLLGGCFRPQGAEYPASSGLPSTDVYFSDSLEGGGVGLGAASQCPHGAPPSCVGLLQHSNVTTIAPATTASDHGM